MEKIFAYSEIGVESLRYHTVELACFDYINARRKLFNLARKTQKPTMEILKAYDIIQDCLIFFNSDWYGDMCSIEPDTLIRNLNSRSNNSDIWDKAASFKRKSDAEENVRGVKNQDIKERMFVHGISYFDLAKQMQVPVDVLFLEMKNKLDVYEKACIEKALSHLCKEAGPKPSNSYQKMMSEYLAELKNRKEKNDGKSL